MIYTYSGLSRDICSLNKKGEISCFTFGKSVMGKPLYCLKAGSGKRRVLYVGAHHSLEWLCSKMLIIFTDIVLSAKDNCRSLFGFDLNEILSQSQIYIVPMLNPDGIDLVAGKIPKASPFYKNAIKMCDEKDIPLLWQANINGVDLNHNYPAGWQSIAPLPCHTRYSGTAPLSEPESRSLYNLTRKIGFDSVIAFHSQGREIYCDFEGYVPLEAETMAEDFARYSGYEIKKPEGVASLGGFKDWFIAEYDRPGFTVEVGYGKNPIYEDQLSDILSENIPIMLKCAEN